MYGNYKIPECQVPPEETRKRIQRWLDMTREEEIRAMSEAINGPAPYLEDLVIAMGTSILLSHDIRCEDSVNGQQDPGLCDPDNGSGLCLH